MELENAKTLLNKRNKAIRFADKSPADWTAVEEYESDELADDSEDEKKLRSAERRTLSKLRVRKQNRSASQIRPKLSQESSYVVGSYRSAGQPFRPQQFPPQRPFTVISYFGEDNHSLPINVSPVGDSGTGRTQHFFQTSSTGTTIEPCQAPLPLPPTTSDQVLNRLGKDEYSNLIVDLCSFSGAACFGR